MPWIPASSSSSAKEQPSTRHLKIKYKENRFSPFTQEKDKISKILSTKQRKRDDEIKRQKFWEEKFEADLWVAGKKGYSHNLLDLLYLFYPLYLLGVLYLLDAL